MSARVRLACDLPDRLTDEDVERAVQRMAEHVWEWRRNGWEPSEHRCEAFPVLVHSGARAMGCHLVDLRNVEVERLGELAYRVMEPGAFGVETLR